MAGIGTMLNYSIEKGIQEQFSNTAGLDSSILSLAWTLGVPVRRKVGARVTVALTTEAQVTVSVPAYSSFDVDGEPYYNKDPFYIIAGRASTQVTLYQGVIETARFRGTGKPYQTYAVSRRFEADDSFFTVLVDKAEYTRTRLPLWSVDRAQRVFQDRTTPEGQVQILFSNPDYAIVPPAGSDIRFIYAVTTGSKGNKQSSSLPVKLVSLFSLSGIPNLPADVVGTSLPGTEAVISETVVTEPDGETTGFTFTLSTAPVLPRSVTLRNGDDYLLVTDTVKAGTLSGDITLGSPSTIDYDSGAVVIRFSHPALAGVPIIASYQAKSGAPYGGADEEQIDELRYTTPRLFASAQQVVRRDDWKAHALNFRGDVVDALVWGEFEAGRTKPNNALLMNVVWMSLLTSSGAFPATGAMAQELENYFQPLQPVGTRIKLVEPVALPVTITISIGVFTGVDVAAVETKVREALRKIFSLKLGSLGAQIYRSDIYDVIKDFPEVDFVNITSLKVTKSGTTTSVSNLLAATNEYFHMDVSDTTAVRISVGVSQRG